MASTCGASGRVRLPVPSPFPAGSEAVSDHDDDMLQRMNGHFFKGMKQDLQPHGEGEYTFKSGTVYTGNFAEGMFDGAGTLTFPSGARLMSTWKSGELVSGQYYFSDELEYHPKDWGYCTDADRRFWSEQQGGMRFSERPQLTDGGEQDTRSIPYGAYDMADCYLDPRDNKLYNYDGTYYRDPTPEELTWAKRKARIGLDKPQADAEQS